MPTSFAHLCTRDEASSEYDRLKQSGLLNQELKQYDIPYNVHHEPNSLEVAKFLNKGVFVDVKVVTNDCAVHSLQHKELGEIRGKLLKNYPKGESVK